MYQGRVGLRPPAKNVVKTSLGVEQIQSSCQSVGNITCPVTVWAYMSSVRLNEKDIITE